MYLSRFDIVNYSICFQKALIYRSKVHDFKMVQYTEVYYMYSKT